MPKRNVSRPLLTAGATWAAAVALAAVGVVPAQAVPEKQAPGPDGRVAGALRSMTVQEMVGQLFFQNVYGSDATTPDARNPQALSWSRGPGRREDRAPARDRPGVE